MLVTSSSLIDRLKRDKRVDGNDEIILKLEAMSSPNRVNGIFMYDRCAVIGRVFGNVGAATVRETLFGG